jgi:hypothetical protein
MEGQPAGDSGNELQQWFTSHGKVVSATPVADPARTSKSAQLIKYVFEDGAELTVRPGQQPLDDQGNPTGEPSAPTEIVTRTLPGNKSGDAKEGDTRGPQTGATREVFRNGKWVVEANPLASNGTATGVTGSNPRVPQGSVPQIEGTPIPGKKNPDGSQAYDNDQPVRVWHAPDGSLIYDPLTPSEVLDWEKKKNGGLTNAEVAQRSQTASAAKPVEGYPGWTVKTTTVGNDTKTVYINPQGQEATDPHPQAVNPNAPKPTQAPDGSWGYWDTTTTPGTPKWTPIQGGPQAEQKPVQVNGKWGVWKPGANGGTPTFAPIQNVPTGAKMPPGVTPPTSFTYGTAAQTLATFWGQLNDAVTKGQITGDEAVALFAPYHEQATLATTEQNNVVTAQRGIMQQQGVERGQDVDLANQRLGTSRDIFNNAFKTTADMNQYAKPGSDAGGKAFLASLRLGRGYAQDFGGLPDIPRTTMLPAVQQAMGATLPTASVVAPVPPPTPTQAAAAGAPAVGSGVTATNAVINAENAGGAPIPSVQAATDATMAGSNAAFGPLIAPTPPDAGQTPVGMLPGVQSTMGTGGYDPNTVSGMLLNLGLDPAAVDQAHQRVTGQSIYGAAA